MVDKMRLLWDLTEFIMGQNDQFRFGQSFFNALCMIDPTTANKIRGTEFDCFHRDDRITEFIVRVKEIWSLQQ